MLTVRNARVAPGAVERSRNWLRRQRRSIVAMAIWGAVMTTITASVDPSLRPIEDVDSSTQF